MGMPASVRHFLFCRRHLLIPDSWAHSFSISVQIGKRRGRVTIWKRKIIAKKLCPIAESVLSQPFSLSSIFRRIQAKQLEDKEEEEPRIRIKERWPISIIIVS
jgi:hypothetical protein